MREIGVQLYGEIRNALLSVHIRRISNIYQVYFSIHWYSSIHWWYSYLAEWEMQENDKAWIPKAGALTRKVASCVEWGENKWKGYFWKKSKTFWRGFPSSSRIYAFHEASGCEDLVYHDSCFRQCLTKDGICNPAFPIIPQKKRRKDFRAIQE